MRRASFREKVDRSIGVDTGIAAKREDERRLRGLGDFAPIEGGMAKPGQPRLDEQRNHAANPGSQRREFDRRGNECLPAQECASAAVDRICERRSPAFQRKQADAAGAPGAEHPRQDTVAPLTITQRGKVVARVPVVTADAVDAATFFDRLRDWLGSPVTLLLLAAFGVCSLYLVLLRRRAVRRRQRRRAQREAEAPVA